MTTHEIKRYTVSGDIAYPIHEDPEGDYVTYLDHVAAIEADRKRGGSIINNASVSSEPVAWPEIELTPEQDEKYNSWVGSDSRKGFERMVARLAYKLNTSGRGLIDYDAAQHFATELRTIFALAASPQPAENSVNLEVAIQAISALLCNDTDWDTSYWNQAVGRCVSELNKLRSQQPAEPVKSIWQTDPWDYINTLRKERDALAKAASSAGFSFLKHADGRVQMVPQIKGEAQSESEHPAEPDSAKCAECGAEMIHVRPGKWQHPDCPQSPWAAEPMKVPSDDEIMSIAALHETHGDAWQDAEYRFTEADFLAAAHALLARYTTPQPAEPCASSVSDKTACGSANRDYDPQPAESTFTAPDCTRCGCVQDGQCLCIPSRPSTEPVKVPSDVEMAAIWDEAHKPFGGAPFLMSHVEYSRALLARYGWPAKEPSKDEIRAIMLKHGYTVKPGHDDLKPYVYAAARELIALAQGRLP